jgi:hypothetical protein
VDEDIANHQLSSFEAGKAGGDPGPYSAGIAPHRRGGETVPAGWSMQSAAKDLLKRHYPGLVARLRDLRRHGRTSTALARKADGVRFVPILGMHRSGTSCVTQVLAACGLHLGNDLVSANEHNPDGFWESRAAVAINDALLGLYAGGYIDPPRYVGRFPDSLYRPAGRFLAGLANARVVGWKDPRTSLTWHAWEEILFGHDYRIVACFRHPYDVAASLMRIHGGMDLPGALRLWTHYNIRILGYSDRLIWVNFNGALGPQISAVCRELGLAFDSQSLDRFRRALVHGRSGDGETPGASEALVVYDCIYRLWERQQSAPGVEARSAP